jgi:uncharacterized protein (TIGR00369 family)
LNQTAKVPSLELHDPIGRNPFFRLIGLELIESHGGHSRFLLNENEDLMNIYRVSHGGVIMSILDAAMASAAMSRIDFTKFVVTIDMSISFLKPGMGRLHALGHATGGGNSVCFCEGEVVDDTGNLVAKALGSFKYRDRSSVSERRLAPV